MPTLDAHLGLAQCQVAARRFDDAAATLGEAEHAEPDDPVVLANLGIVLSDVGRDRDAIAPLQRALTLDPDFHQARFNLARVFARAGQRAEPRAKRGTPHAPAGERTSSARKCSGCSTL